MVILPFAMSAVKSRGEGCEGGEGTMDKMTPFTASSNPRGQTRAIRLGKRRRSRWREFETSLERLNKPDQERALSREGTPTSHISAIA